MNTHHEPPPPFTKATLISFIKLLVTDRENAQDIIHAYFNDRMEYIREKEYSIHIHQAPQQRKEFRKQYRYRQQVEAISTVELNGYTQPELLKMQRGPANTPPATISFLNSPLPTDNNRCAYYRIANDTMETLDLVRGCIVFFHKAIGFYPSVIYLSSDRWLFGQIMGHFTLPGGQAIPYAHAQDDTYDVCVKSQPLHD